MWRKVCGGGNLAQLSPVGPAVHNVMAILALEQAIWRESQFLIDLSKRSA